jgi:ABC-type multidrug transport system fused ATPase/permease subunit
MSLYLRELNIILFLIIMNIQIIFSETKKCYSIFNCKKCPELDICEICSKGYILNKKKNKCIKASVSSFNSFTINSKHKPSEKSFSKINVSSSIKPFLNNINSSLIKKNIDEVVLSPKHSNILLSKISSDYLKNEEKSFQKYYDKFNKSINLINQKYSDNDFYYRITLAWIILLIVVLAILLIFYLSRKVRNRFEYVTDDLEELSRIVNIR